MQLPRTPSFRLDGKRALVTGASRGIGLACAAALAEAGAATTRAATFWKRRWRRRGPAPAWERSAWRWKRCSAGTGPR